MPFLDKYTEERKTGGFLDRYTEEERPDFMQRIRRKPSLREKEEPTFTKFLKGIRSIRDVGRKILTPEEEVSPLGLARHLGTAVPRFALDFLAAPHGLVKMMEEEPPPAEEAVEEFVRGIPLVGAGRRIAGGEGRELLHEYYKYPERAAMEAIMPLFMKHIFSMKPPPTRPALPRPPVPRMAEAFERLAKPKEEIPFPGLKEKIVPSEEVLPRTVLEDILGREKVRPKKEPVPGEAELKLARELKERGVTEKPAEIPAEMTLSEVELKTLANEMLNDTKIIQPPVVSKLKPGFGGVRVVYDPASTPPWYPGVGLDKTQTMAGLKSIVKDGYGAKNKYAQNLFEKIQDWSKAKARHEPPTAEITGGDLVAGDKVKIQGEWYTAKPEPKTGTIELIDAQNIRLDIFEKLPVQEIQKAKVPTYEKGAVFQKDLLGKEKVVEKPRPAEQPIMPGMDRMLAEGELGKKMKKVEGVKEVKEELYGRKEPEVLPGQMKLPAGERQIRIVGRLRTKHGGTLEDFYLPESIAKNISDHWEFIKYAKEYVSKEVHERYSMLMRGEPIGEILAKPKPAAKAVKEPFLDKAEKSARGRIKKRGVRLTTGIDPAEMADYAIIGAAKIGRGTIKFADWSAEMVKEFGDRIKPHLKTIYARSQRGLPKLKSNAELDSFLDYFEDIQAPVGFRPPRKPARVAIRERLREEGLKGKELTLEADAEFIKAVQDYKIALRKTGTGKIQPAIREAGTYVPEDFATYTEFKDAKAGVFGGTKDATRFIQEIDGALPVEAKAKLPGQAGPAEQYVLHRTRDMVKFKLNWTKAMKSRLAAITKDLSKEQTQIANQVIEHISREGAYVDPAKLVTNPKISALTTDVNVIRLAQEGRKLYESLLRHQNEARRLRGQTEIPHRDYYTAHSIHETTIWERALGHNKTPEQIVGPGLPDYIKPNAPFNPRAMAREIGLPETVREMNLSVLLERYIETAAKDIYNTSIVQNNKAFIQQLKSMGYEHAARGLENWTAEAFGGVRAAVDRVANLSPTVHKGMSRFRRGLLRSVFPLNFAWNTFVQTSSGVLTVTRYGVRNSVRGLYDWFGSKKIRQEIRDNAYSAIVKSQRSGRISQQDINRGIGAAERVNRGRLEKVSDAANFFTEWVERHLTGWSVAAAKRHGASAGLKGKPLWEYASDGGAKTQSMYNLEDLPGMLRSEVVKTGAPFQTFSFEIYNTCKEFAGKAGCPPATTAIRIKWVLRFLAGATAVNYIGEAAIGRKPWELSSFVPFYGTFIAPISAALRGEDVSMVTTRGLPSPVGIAIRGGQAVHKGLLRPGFAVTKEFARTRDFRAALKEFMATGKWDKLRRFTIRYLSGFVGVPGGVQMNRVVDGLIAVSAGGMVDSADRMMFPITDTKDKIRSFLAGPWATKGGQEYWDKRGGELNLDIEFLEQNPLLRDVTESLPIVGDFYKFRKDSESQTKQAILRMLRTGNIKSALDKKIEWNMENPDNKISDEWYTKQLRGAISPKGEPISAIPKTEEVTYAGMLPGASIIDKPLMRMAGKIAKKIGDLINSNPEEGFIGPQPEGKPPPKEKTPTEKIPYFTGHLLYTKGHPEVADSLVSFAKQIDFDKFVKQNSKKSIKGQATAIGEFITKLGFGYGGQSTERSVWKKYGRLQNAPILEHSVNCATAADLFYIFGKATGLDVERIRGKLKRTTSTYSAPNIKHAYMVVQATDFDKQGEWYYFVETFKTPSHVKPPRISYEVSGPYAKHLLEQRWQFLDTEEKYVKSQEWSFPRKLFENLRQNVRPGWD